MAQDRRYYPAEGRSERPERPPRQSSSSSRRQSQNFSDEGTFFPSELLRTGSDLSQVAENIVVVVMGVTGSGKSTFISLLADQPVQVGHGLHSNTVDVGIYSFEDENRRTIMLVDTPGFDDTSRSDAEILKDIAFFLATLRQQNFHFAGLIYLHRITDPRMQGSALKNLRMFQHLCGESNFRHVVVATTMWEDMESSEEGGRVGNQRQTELTRLDFFGKMIRSGAEIRKHDGSRPSAYDLVSLLTDRDDAVVLDIQRELVDERKSLDDTAAGQFLQQELVEAKERFEEELGQLQEGLEDALQARDDEALREIRAEKLAAEARAEQHDRDRESLKINMEQLAHEKQLQYRNIAASHQEQERAPLYDSQLADLTRQIGDLQDQLRELVRRRERDRESMGRSQSYQASQETHSRRLRDQTSERERHVIERTLQALRVERQQTEERQRRQSPFTTFVRGILNLQEESERYVVSRRRKNLRPSDQNQR